MDGPLPGGLAQSEPRGDSPESARRVSLPARLVVWLIGLYKRFLSPLLPPMCRFEPTCSQYAAQAIGRHGLWRGGWLALRRLLRCNPMFPGGPDPVP
ncbi:MAG: membrane protein insertion efficiency factor YidD [Armatimonadetes bacterium]|nr:membrane protein insertion efficiency factor YidD [Armatimonadota bacterium]